MHLIQAGKRAMFRKNSVKGKLKEDFVKKNGEDSQDSGKLSAFFIICAINQEN